MANNFAPPTPPNPEQIARTRTLALQFAARSIEDFTHVDSKIVIKDLASNDEVGLTSKEASIRLERHGKNELEKPPPDPIWRMFWDQLSDPLIALLFCACIASYATKEYLAGSVILGIVILNATLGVYQEFRAGGELEALQTLTKDDSHVIRDGQRILVDSTFLVPGDIVILETGMKIPADLRLIESSDLASEEAALTGESLEVKKDAKWIEPYDDVVDKNSPNTTDDKQTDEPKKEKSLSSKNMVFMGCSVTDGRGKGVVVKTGMDTKMGHVASLLANTEDSRTPLQIRLHKLGIYLGLASIAISLIVFIIGAATKAEFQPGMNRWVSLTLVTVSLVVAAVPEALPAAVTITLALGMKRMIKKGALIRDLHSVETLGSASVICSDKTGTLTRGVMTAARLWFDKKVWKITGTGYSPDGKFIKLNSSGEELGPEEIGSSMLNPEHKTLLAAALCSNASLQKNAETGEWECLGNSSERPLVVAAAKAGIDVSSISTSFKRVRENPFNSSRKTMSVFVENSTDSAFGTCGFLSIVKGAPNIVLGLCENIMTEDGVTERELVEEERQEILGVIDSFSAQAFRVLAVAIKRYDTMPVSETHELVPDMIEKDLTLCGLVASIDPEREEVIPSISQCYDAGIRVVMITGDYVKTARAIAENIHLLPKNAPERAAIDCEVIREYGTELANLKEKLKRKEGDKHAILARITELQAMVDDITKTADVYARAKPVDKITIVESLQRQGNICSMTGDGVNDAPALKQANIGVAMGITGTDVAKGAASMVLTNDDFCSIVSAVEEGRTIYSNIVKFVYYLLSTNVSEVFFVTIAVIAGFPTPLVPEQILYLNLVTDGAPALALAVEKTEAGTMSEGPRKPNESLLSKLVIVGVIIHNFILTILCMLVYVLGHEYYVGSYGPLSDISGYENEHKKGIRQAQTMAILFIVFAELLRANTCRSLRQSIFSLGLFSNVYMLYSVIPAFVLTVLLNVIPKINGAFGMEYLDLKGYITVVVLSLIPAIIDELVKLVYRMTGFGERPKAIRYDQQRQLEKAEV